LKAILKSNCIEVITIIRQDFAEWDITKEVSQVLLVASLNREKVIQSSPYKIEIFKPNDTEILELNVTLSINTNLIIKSRIGYADYFSFVQGEKL
jgi:hypothetical protein